MSIDTQNGHGKFLIRTAFKAQFNNSSKNLQNLYLRKWWREHETLTQKELNSCLSSLLLCNLGELLTLSETQVSLSVTCR